MTRKKWIPAVLIFGTALLVSTPAHANAMLPLIIGGWLVMIPALVPIILIESAILMRIGTGMWQSLLAMSAANITSTLVGIPLAIILEIVVAGSTPLYDANHSTHGWSKWTLPVGGVLLLIPFFLLSWWIEALIAVWILDELPSYLVDRAVRDGNIVTYSILAVLLGGVLTQEILNYAKRRKTEKAARAEELKNAKYVDLQPAEEGVEYIEGEAQVAVEGLSVDSHPVATEKTIIATGSTPAPSDIPETDDQLGLLEVLKEDRSKIIGKTGALDVLHGESAKRKTIPPTQTEDTDLAA